MNCKAGMDFFPSTNFMLQPPHDHQDPPNSSTPHLLTSWFPQDFHGVASTESLLGKRSPPPSMLFSGFETYEQQQQQQQQQQEHSMTGDEELSSDDIDGSSGHQAMLLGERKKRLNIDQVKTLEKSFELHGTKLEPDRKMQLAKAIGLQPRQVAIWFQNRRARWKTKQLEKDYDLLKRQFDAIKADNDALHAQNRKLNAEILALKGSRNNPSHEQINLNRETEGSGSNRSSDNTSDLKLNFSTPTPPSSITEQDHEQEHPQQHQIPTSRQFFPPSGLTNMFPGIEDQPGLIWPWLDQQHQHLNN